MPWNPVMVRQQWLVNSNNMNIHKVTTSPIAKPRDLIMISKVTLPKYDVAKGNVIK